MNMKILLHCLFIITYSYSSDASPVDIGASIERVPRDIEDLSTNLTPTEELTKITEIADNITEEVTVSTKTLPTDDELSSKCFSYCMANKIDFEKSDKSISTNENQTTTNQNSTEDFGNIVIQSKSKSDPSPVVKSSFSPVSSLEDIVKAWGDHVSKNVNGGGATTHINDDDAEMRKRDIKVTYKLEELNAGEYAKGEPDVTVEGENENRSDQEEKQEITFEKKKSFEAISRLTSGIKVSTSASFGIEGIGEGKISIEVNLENEETRSESETTTLSSKTTITIPPHSKIKNTLQTTKQKQKVPFTGKLFIEGQVGVYFENKVCNVFGNGCDTDGHHYKWFPNVKQIAEWAIENEYAKWHITDDGKVYVDIEGESDVTLYSYKQVTGETESI